MNHIFELLRQSQKASQIANDLEGRSPFFEFAIVTDNNDPMGKRRVKVAMQSKGGLTTTDWLYRLTIDPYSDPPVPRVGQTVGVMFASGDGHTGCYFGCITNQPNPERSTSTPIEDDSRLIEGDRIETINREDKQRVDLNQTVSVGKKLRMQNDAGAYIELHELGAVILGDAFGNRWVLGGQSAGIGEPTDFVWDTVSGNCRWNLGNNDLEIVNAGDVSIAGKSVATIGAVDSDGDVLNTRGW